MKTKNQIIEVLFKGIEEFNIQNHTSIPKDLNYKLFGVESELDSLGLVNLIVIIEDCINDHFNLNISINDEKAMSQKNSPFRTIHTLADYLEPLINL